MYGGGCGEDGEGDYWKEDAVFSEEIMMGLFF